MGNWLKGALVGTRLEIAYLRCIMMKGSLSYLGLMTAAFISFNT